MSHSSGKIMAACGLICNDCPIFQASDDPRIAGSISKWFKENQNIDIKPEQIGCSGCLGNREKHWSPECWILKCCVDDRGLDNCSQCDEFPCDRLNKWAGENDKYAEAITRLKEIA